jgi:hypothetical protein
MEQCLTGLSSSRCTASKPMAPSLLVKALAIACARSVGASEGNGIEAEPVWRVLAVLIGFVLISAVLEIGLHKAKHHCTHTKAYGVLHAIDQIEEELMLLGFIMLLLTVVEKNLIDVCLHDSSWVGVMCEAHPPTSGHASPPGVLFDRLQTAAPFDGPGTDHASSVPSTDHAIGVHRRRLLSGAAICDAGSSSFLNSHTMGQVCSNNNGPSLLLRSTCI